MVEGQAYKTGQSCLKGYLADCRLVGAELGLGAQAPFDRGNCIGTLDLTWLEVGFSREVQV